MEEKTSKKKQMFKESDDFENRPSSKGDRPCKMVSLGQKLKMPKTWEKPFYKNIRLVLWKKPVEKHRIFEKWDDFENQPSCRGYCLYKMVTFGHKFKMLNTGEEPFSKNIRVVLCKKRLEKAPNIWEMRRFLQSAILQML